MKNLPSKLAPLFILLIVLAGALAPVFQAQDLGGTVRVMSDPEGPYFAVDGQNYNHAMSAVWPAGSKHTLSVQSTEQDGLGSKSKFSFGGWQASQGTLPPGNTITVVADPSVSSYTAKFSVQYALTLAYFSCPDPAHCDSPGQIYVAGTAFSNDQDIYMGAGAVTLTAAPNPGWIFLRWEPGFGQVIQGPTDTVTMNGPVTVYPRFGRARTINLTAVPAGLTVLADRTKVPTPTSLDWGYDTVHSLGAISPQMDINGRWWAFQSWSDGGAVNHSYTVAETATPAQIVANYVAAASTLLTTSPPGLSLKVDGKDPGAPYSFLWGVGEVHHLEAPAQQTDAQGRIWSFSNWSNGAAAAQDFTVPPNADTVGVRLVANYTAVGHLTVNSTIAGLTVKVDGTDCATPCDVQRPTGTSVHVTAPASVPQGDSVRADFSGWPGSGSTATDWTVTLNGDPVTLTADYHIMNRLATAATPPEGAKWSLLPASQDGFYDAQTMVSVSVSALPGYRFHSWSGDLGGTKPAGVVAMTAPRSVQAQLDRIPYISPTGVSNAAGSTPQTAVAAGSVVSIFGASFAAATVIGPDSPLTQTIGGVTVRLGDRFMPLFFVSPTQINFQLPDDVGLGSPTLTVSSDGLPDVQAGFKVVRNAPGLFVSKVVDDQLFAMAVHEDGSAVTVDAPALKGELLTIYGTGFGPTDHGRPVGFAVPAAPPYLIVDGATVLVGDAVLTAENAFAVPARVGIDAVQFRLGDTAPTGTNASLHLTINGQDSNTVLLPVK